ncbi:beta-ketoacyl synthase N-terminal-like domain-containing protein [Streptomyces sp. NPDC018693]|uniref:beta-ketoacyl synthase N-terminal-like domain-containing protein n=1 Tax=unclassified Streptomyces TaxID=2593676 RepID=UPI0037AF3232
MEPAEIRQLMEEQLRLSRRLQARIRELEEERRAPVAVVGMGLRLPGGLSSPEEYWDFLRGEESAYSRIPEDRPGLRAVYDPVPGKPGRSYVDTAGFLTDIAHFDADFFGISQREARQLDPQQRLLLETAWEALERAGLAVRRGDRLPVGVYLGMMASEYSERVEDRADLSRVGPYYTTGGGLCFGAGRIAYALGFSGPVVSVDTACSSSLTALHLAVRGLRSGECRYALVCGSNLLLSANLMVSLCQTRALSPDGRSKSFLASADGYGRGEGVGAVALMRLADAEREGRPVLAVIRGSALNHDGAASGLTAPSGPAQQEVIGAALADAGVEPADLGWVEAHGTGTVLGDPIEVGALDAVLGPAVRERGLPLQIGSVKSRLGHLEAASGVAALIKTVLMLRHGEIPAAAHPQDGELNPHIPWERIGFEVPRANRPWPRRLPRRVAGVNSFGMSGTNVHVILEAYDPTPAPAQDTGAPLRPELVTLSAKDPRALVELADAVADRLRKTDPAQLPSLCHTLRGGRAPHPYRIAVTGHTAADLADRLEQARGRAAGARRAGQPPRVTLRTPTDATTVTTALAAAYPALDRRDGAAGAADPVSDGGVAGGVGYPALDGGVAGGAGYPAPDGRAAVAAACPSLDGREVAPAAARLAGFLEGLGVRVRLTADAGGDAVTVEWDDGTGPAARVLDGRAVEDTFPELLGLLFEAGCDLRLDALAAPGTRLLGDLPTYPFQRRRHWVEEPPLGGGAAPPGHGRAQAVAPPDGGGVEEITGFLVRVLKEALETTDELDLERSFLDEGGDSFISTLFITRVEERYEVGLTAAELPLDLPLRTLLGKLAQDIAGRAGAAGKPAEECGA